MKLSIINEDNAIYMDGEHLSPCDLSFLDSNIKAVQWNDDTKIGHYEYKDAPNKELSHFDYLEQTIKSYANCKEFYRIKKLEEEEAKRLEKLNAIKKWTIPVASPQGGNDENFQFLERDDVDPMISIVANCWVKQMKFNKVGDVHPGHKHSFDHQTLLAKGKLELHVNGEVTVFTAPTIIFIKAGLRHGMISLEDNTIVYCLHPLRDGEQVGDIISPDQVPNGVMPLVMNRDNTLIPTDML
jgi:quercetin dioxygenase-like cupin family protein